MFKKGQQIGHYTISAILGIGGMGEVFLAEDTRLHRKVALKLLPENIASKKERLRRFEQEAFAASALNHPNILTIYEFGNENETHFLATEYVDGETLRKKIKSDELNLVKLLKIAEQIAFGLSAAHDAGIVHRDLKPENVMIRRDGIVKIVDFGLAKLLEKQETDPDAEAETRALVKTNPGLVMGTVAYMSSEQARGKDTDERTDIWSLGVLLYEMVSGKLPFAGETTNDVIASILTREPPLLSNFIFDIPIDLEKIVGKCLRKDREKRYQNIKDLQIDLKDLRQDLAFQIKLERSAAPNILPTNDNGSETQAQILEVGKETGAAKAVATESEVTHHPSTSAEYLVSQINRHRRGLTAILFIFLLGGIGYWFYTNRSTGSNTINSIAVLPFENRNSDTDTEYLFTGLTETLIYRLSQLPNLKVSLPSLVFRYKSKETDSIKIGNEPGVNAVMSGRIVQRGDNLMISVELVDVLNNKLLWGEQYERKMSELLATQRDIAMEIAQKLQLKLSVDEKGLTKQYTDNNEAYQLYLKGRYHFAKRTKEDMQRSIEYFQQAIQLDPNFALAYTSIAECYNAISFYPYIAPKESFPQAKVAAQRALEIDPTLAEAHTALASYFATYNWNWVEAESEFKRAIELNPNSSEAHFRYGQLYLAPLGRFDEAIAELKRALELEPLSLITGANLAAVYMYAGQNDRAVDQARKTYELEPRFVAGRYYLGLTYNAAGMYAEAIALSEKALQTDSTDQLMLRIAGYAFAKIGRRSEAEDVIKRFNEHSKTQYVMSYWIASIYAALGEKEKAFIELEKAFAERDWELHRLKVDPLMSSLRDDPRFKNLIRRVRLAE